jgi:hypothetical protein
MSAGVPVNQTSCRSEYVDAFITKHAYELLLVVQQNPKKGHHGNQVL